MKRKEYEITYMDMRVHRRLIKKRIKCFDLNNWQRVFALRGFQIIQYRKIA